MRYVRSAQTVDYLSLTKRLPRHLDRSQHLPLLSTGCLFERGVALITVGKELSLNIGVHVRRHPIQEALHGSAVPESGRVVDSRRLGSSSISLDLCHLDTQKPPCHRPHPNRTPQMCASTSYTESESDLQDQNMRSCCRVTARRV